jgi:hypothetical protein
VHLDRYVVVRQIDGGAPQPPQRFSPTQFLEWAKKQTALAQQVFTRAALSTCGRAKTKFLSLRAWEQAVGYHDRDKQKFARNLTDIVGWMGGKV